MGVRSDRVPSLVQEERAREQWRDGGSDLPRHIQVRLDRYCCCSPYAGRRCPEGPEPSSTVAGDTPPRRELSRLDLMVHSQRRQRMPAPVPGSTLSPAAGHRRQVPGHRLQR